MRPLPERRLVILTEGQWDVHNAKTAIGVMRYGRDPVSYTHLTLPTILRV